MMNTSNLYLSDYQVTELDTTSKEKKYRLTTPNADVKINETTKEFLQYLQENEGRSASNIVSEYSEDASVSAQSVKKILKNLSEKKVLLEEPPSNNQGKEWKEERLSYRGEMNNLWFRKKLFDTDKYSWFFKKLGFIFSKPFVVVAITSFLIFDIYFFYSIFFSSGEAGLRYYSYFDYLVFFPLGWLLGFIHELGHTVATKKNDLPMPKGVGIGLYYFMIVFYADTHETWNLSRKKRAVVSTAGFYWNVLTLIILIPICFLIRSAALKDFILLFHISILSVFNPFLKMDGYWLLTDLLGVTNLHHKVRSYFKGLIRGEDKIQGETKPFKGYPRKIQLAVLVYGVIYFLFLGVFLGFFLYKAGLIASSFEAEVLGGFMDIIGAKAGSRGNIARNINYLIRNLAILTGAFMLTVTGARRIFSLLCETRENK